MTTPARYHVTELVQTRVYGLGRVTMNWWDGARWVYRIRFDSEPLSQGRTGDRRSVTGRANESAPRAITHDHDVDFVEDSVLPPDAVDRLGELAR